jgi:hypothetical protein
MKKYRFRTYRKYIVFLVLGALLIIGTFNWLVDPYGLFGSPRINGFNSLKPEFGTHERMVKAAIIDRLKPRAICLGSSHVGIGIDPLHPGWSYSPVYNAGLSSAHIYEMTRFFQQANASKQLKQVILALDFWSFTNIRGAGTAFNEEYLSIDYFGNKQSTVKIETKMMQLFSYDTLVSSFKTITRQTKPDTAIRNDGFYIEDMVYKGLTDYHASFVNQEAAFADTVYVPAYFPPFDLRASASPLGYFRTILRTCYQDNIDLRISISPSHVREWEVLTNVGLWPRFEEWKRSLVQINDEEAQRVGKPPFALWDFATYNSFTTEDLPPSGDNQTTMKWYWNIDHYKKALGDIMLDRIFGLPYENGISIDDFGTLITLGNIDEHLEKIRIDQQLYRNTHQKDVDEINKITKNKANTNIVVP